MSTARTKVLRTNLSPAEHKLFGQACKRIGAQKAEVLREFALWMIDNVTDLRSKQFWLHPQLDAAARSSKTDVPSK